MNQPGDRELFVYKSSLVLQQHKNKGKRVLKCVVYFMQNNLSLLFVTKCTGFLF